MHFAVYEDDDGSSPFGPAKDDNDAVLSVRSVRSVRAVLAVRTVRGMFHGLRHEFPQNAVIIALTGLTSILASVPIQAFQQRSTTSWNVQPIALTTLTSMKHTNFAIFKENKI